MPDVAFGSEFGFLEVRQDLFRAFEDWFGNASKARDLNPVTLVGAAFDDFPQENDRVAPFANGDIEIAQAWQARSKFGQFVVVGSEKGFGPDLIVEMFDNTPGQA